LLKAFFLFLMYLVRSAGQCLGLDDVFEAVHGGEVLHVRALDDVLHRKHADNHVVLLPAHHEVADAAREHFLLKSTQVESFRLRVQGDN